MRLLYAIRIFTLLIAISYSAAVLPLPWLYWLEAHFCDSQPIYETGYSSLIAAGEIGVYVSAIVGAFVVFLAVPRFRWGAPLLSWCFLFMGACMLTNLERGYWNRYLSLFIQISSYAQELCLALPPLIIGLVLRYRIVQAQLNSTSTSVTNYR